MSAQIEQHPRRQEILKRLEEGKLTISEAAGELGVEYYILWRFLRERHATETTLSVESLDEKVSLLGEILDKVTSNVKNLLQEASTGEGLRYGPAWVRELRNLVTDLARLQQQVLTSPTVLVQNVIQTQTQLQTFLIQNLCPACKDCFIKFLEENK